MRAKSNSPSPAQRQVQPEWQKTISYQFRAVRLSRLRQSVGRRQRRWVPLCEGALVSAMLWFKPLKIVSVNGLILNNNWLQFILLLVILGSPSASAATNEIAPAKFSYIVTLRREADQDGCARAFSVQRHHIYRHALNGFAANLDAATVEKLKHDSRVLAVEPDGDVVLDATTVIPAGQLTNQIVPSGILRMGLTNFPMTHINGQDNRINVDVAVLDTGEIGRA